MYSVQYAHYIGGCMKNITMSKIITLVALMIPGVLKADIEVKRIGVSPQAVSSAGYIAGTQQYGDIPRIITPDGLVSNAGTYAYVPTSINNFGDLVGIRGGNYDNDYTSYAFYTASGKESIVLGTFPDQESSSLPAIGINDNKVAYLITLDKVIVFNAGTKVAEAAVSAPLQLMSLAAVLSDNRALVVLTDAGTAKYGILSQSGSVTPLADPIISKQATVKTILANGKILFLLDNTLYETDLINPAVASSIEIPKKTDLEGLNPQGKKIVMRYGKKGVEHYYVKSNGTLSPELSCIVPKSLNKVSSFVTSASLLGLGSGTKQDILATYYSDGTGARIIHFDEATVADYCTQVELTVGNDCNKHFARDGAGGLKLTAPFTQKSSCTINAVVKKSGGKPLSNAKILTDGFLRGKTGANGKLSFKMSFSADYFNINLIAFHKGDTYLSSSAVIHQY